MWPGQLPYYVERYHVRLPAEFVAYMAANDWTPPDLDDQDLAELENDYLGDVKRG